MKHILLVLIAVAIASIGYQTSFAQNIEQQEIEALEAFNAGDYNTVIVIYEALLADNPYLRNGHYNLGLAYYESGLIGPGLLNLRKAQLIGPRDRELNATIAIIRAERLDVQGDERSLIDRAVTLLQTVLTVRELSWIVVGLWLVCGSLATGCVLSLRLRQLLLPILTVLSVAAVASVLLWGVVSYVNANRPVAVATVTVALRSGPGVTYPELFDVFPAGEMRVVERRDTWGRVLLPDGRQGWVEVNAISFVSIE